MTTTSRKLGIWMDHSNAHPIECSGPAGDMATTEISFVNTSKDADMARGEHMMHNKEQQLDKDYYKKLGELIKDFDEIILFGPTNAKSELMNTLKSDHHFDKIHIDIRQSDKMTNNQQHAFVKEYFSGK